MYSDGCQVLDMQVLSGGGIWPLFDGSDLWKEFVRQIMLHSKCNRKESEANWRVSNGVASKDIVRNKLGQQHES